MKLEIAMRGLIASRWHEFIYDLIFSIFLKFQPWNGEDREGI